MILLTRVTICILFWPCYHLAADVHYIVLYYVYKRIVMLPFKKLSTDIRKITRISHVMKIRPVGAELFHADGQKDLTKLIIVFSLFFFSNTCKSITKLILHYHSVVPPIVIGVVIIVFLSLNTKQWPRQSVRNGVYEVKLWGGHFGRNIVVLQLGGVGQVLTAPRLNPYRTNVENRVSS